jgi:hypothetical protein
MRRGGGRVNVLERRFVARWKVTGDQVNTKRTGSRSPPVHRRHRYRREMPMVESDETTCPDCGAPAVAQWMREYDGKGRVRQEACTSIESTNADCSRSESAWREPLRVDE